MAALFEAKATAGAAGAADSSTTSGCVVTVAAVIVCQWLHHVRLWLAVAGFGLGNLAREALRLCLVETVSPVSRRRFASVRSSRCSHLVPIDEAPASGLMLRAVCVLCCCVHE